MKHFSDMCHCRAMLSRKTQTMTSEPLHEKIKPRLAVVQQIFKNNPMPEVIFRLARNATFENVLMDVSWLSREPHHGRTTIDTQHSSSPGTLRSLSSAKGKQGKRDIKEKACGEKYKGVNHGTGGGGKGGLEGVTVVWWLDYSPPTKVNWVSTPGRATPGFLQSGNRDGRYLWSAGFLADPLFPLPLHSGAAPYSPRFPLIASQDLNVKSRPNLFTYTHSLFTGKPAWRWFSASEAEKRGSDKAYTIPRIKCTIAIKSKAQNWRAVSTYVTSRDDPILLLVFILPVLYLVRPCFSEAVNNVLYTQRQLLTEERCISFNKSGFLQGTVPWWDVSGLTAQPPRPRDQYNITDSNGSRVRPPFAAHGVRRDLEEVALTVWSRGSIRRRLPLALTTGEAEGNIARRRTTMHWACVLVSPISLPRFLTLNAQVHRTLNSGVGQAVRPRSRSEGAIRSIAILSPVMRPSIWWTQVLRFAADGGGTCSARDR
ncbi:hypothetical protein PR048_015581 [Dryococelus australis]|uniref:Uncharacterized protein n=1 Tax=Dryococelus australis TaxID=614101 RepID=A0ABQ9HHC2_9NEOP|nr:hypothetical protein PR048_015581 [Dryococelus australis]